jgi:hypothetical protein
MYGA